MLRITRVFLTFLSLLPWFAEADVSGSVIIHASSNAVYNGLTENGDQPTIAINTELQLNKNWIFGVQLQDSEPVGLRQRQRAFTTYLGVDYQLSENWLGSAYAVSRQFIDAAVDWNYDEFSLTLSHESGASFDVTYSPNYYACSVKAIGAVMSYHHQLSDNFYVKSRLGNLHIHSMVNYPFSEFALGASFGRLNAELGYHWTKQNDISLRIGPIESPQWVLSVSYLAF